MIRAEFDLENLQKYILHLYGIVNVSIAILDTTLSPILEAGATADPAIRADKIRERLSEGQKTPVFWNSNVQTTEFAAPVYYEDILFAYVWIGNFYFEANVNPHTNSVRENCPVYDWRTVDDILGILNIGVLFFLSDIHKIDLELQNKIDQYILTNLNKKITLSALSSTLNIGSANIRAFFLEALNCKLPDYLRKKRIEAAEGLLTETDLSLSEISEKIGLPEEQWVRAFKKQTSVTPDEYRAKSRKATPINA